MSARKSTRLPPGPLPPGHRSAAPPLTVAVVGCGRAGTRRINAILSAPATRLVAVCDSNPVALAAAIPLTRPDCARTSGRTRGTESGSVGPTLSHEGRADLPVFRSFDEMLAAVAPDALVISTPPAFHAPQAAAALRKGIRCLLVEKPVTCTAAAARDLAHLAAQTRACIKVGSNTRCFPEVAALHDLLATQALGKLRHASFRIGHDGNTLPAWAHDPCLAGGGTLLDNGVHLLDLALWLGLVPARAAHRGQWTPGSRHRAGRHSKSNHLSPRGRGRPDRALHGAHDVGTRAGGVGAGEGALEPGSVRAEFSWASPAIDHTAEWSFAGDGLTLDFRSTWHNGNAPYLDVTLEGDGGTAHLVAGTADSYVEHCPSGAGPHRHCFPRASSWEADTHAFLAAAAAGRTCHPDISQAAACLELAELVYLAASRGRPAHD